MTTYFNYDMSDANTEVAYFDADPDPDYYICRSRFDGSDPTIFEAGTYSTFNHGSSPGPADVEVSLSGGEMLLQLKNDWVPFGLGRLQLDMPNAPDGTKAYMETKTIRLPASMQPYTTYGPTWYSLCEYRIGLNFADPPENDTQFQVNVFNPAGENYLLFSPTINHYNLTTLQYDNRWQGSPSVQVPIDEDFDMQTLIRSDLVKGRWLCMIKLQGEAWQVLFDYEGNTLHPDETDEDFRMIQPLKVYTNSTLINWMNVNSGECALACSRLQAWVGT